MFGNPPAIDRVTCQPGLTANGEPTSNIALTIPYRQISADDNYGIITIIYGNLDPSEGTGGDPFTEFELPPGYAYLVDGNGAFVLDGAGRYIIVYAELPEAPSGYAYLINAGGKYLINATGAYILAAVPPAVPDWVPANAKIYIDLVNDRAWTEADGIVAIDTLLGADADAGSTFDVADISSSGLASTSMPNFTDAAGVIDTAGRTFVFELVTHSSAGNFELDLTTDFATFDPDYYFLARTAPSSTSFISTSTPGDADLTDAQLLLASAVNRVAFTVTPTHAAFSINGATVASKAVTASFAAITNAVIYGDYAFLRTIAVYPVRADADLPALSRVIPDDAKIHINLVQDWAWTEADGYVAIDTLLGTDTNTVNGWDTTEYDASRLTADGYVEHDHPPALIGEGLTKVLAGATLTVKMKQVTATQQTHYAFVKIAADGLDVLEFDLNAVAEGSIGHAFRWNNGQFTLDNNTTATVNGGDGAINVAAITVTDLRFDVAVNGSPAVEGSHSATDLVAVVIDAGAGTNTALQSITIYDALPSTAGLSALSETGVTNTAPHDLVLTWYDNGAFGSNGSYVQGSFTAASPQTFASFGFLSAADSEGNPITFSVTADETAKLYIENSTALAAQSDFTSIGNFNFTLRATDPGGLYVEQEFTITVTSGVPDWVPTNAKIYIDLVNDRAWTETDGEVAIDTLLGADANTENALQMTPGFGPTEYDPEHLGPNGYSAETNLAVASIGILRTALFAGATLRFQTYQETDDGGAIELLIVPAAGNPGIEFVVDNDKKQVTVGSWTGSLEAEINNIINFIEGGHATNVIALTLTPERFEFSANRSSVSANVLTTEEYPDDVLVASFFTLNGGQALQSITMYDALPSTAGLSALSETGVTNTTPHDFTWNWQWPDGIFPLTDIDVNNVAGYHILDSLAVTDDEGNPVVFTMVDSEAGLFQFSELSPTQVTITAPLTEGVHNFTLRATDPGGLYVEQEFTITVTP